MRIFFALLPEPAQADALVATVAPLVQELDGQPVVATNVHATLCFIGSVDAERLDALRAAASRVRSRPVTLQFDALDVWEQPEILCATADSSDAARDLSSSLSNTMSEAGFTPDGREFLPHLTLARRVRRRVARNFDWPRALAPVRICCEQFVLMESRRVEGRSTYSVVDSWPLDEK